MIYINIIRKSTDCCLINSAWIMENQYNNSHWQGSDNSSTSNCYPYESSGLDDYILGRQQHHVYNLRSLPQPEDKYCNSTDCTNYGIEVDWYSLNRDTERQSLNSFNDIQFDDPVPPKSNDNLLITVNKGK